MEKKLTRRKDLATLGNRPILLLLCSDARLQNSWKSCCRQWSEPGPYFSSFCFFLLPSCFVELSNFWKLRLEVLFCFLFPSFHVWSVATWWADSRTPFPLFPLLLLCVLRSPSAMESLSDRRTVYWCSVLCSILGSYVSSSSLELR